MKQKKEGWRNLKNGHNQNWPRLSRWPKFKKTGKFFSFPRTKVVELKSFLCQEQIFLDEEKLSENCFRLKSCLKFRPCFYNLDHSRLFDIYFRRCIAVDIEAMQPRHINVKNVLVVGFKLWISGVGSNCSDICATTTAQMLRLFILSMTQNILATRALVVAQLAVRSLPTPKICSSNPFICKIFSTNCTNKNRKTKIKKKRPGMAHL